MDFLTDNLKKNTIQIYQKKFKNLTSNGFLKNSITNQIFLKNHYQQILLIHSQS